jgi:hypothetical protein
MAYNTKKGEEQPQGQKRKMTLRTFSSFEAAAQAEAADSARKPPMEGLRETVELILRAYGVTREQLAANRKKMRLTIIRNG